LGLARRLAVVVLWKGGQIAERAVDLGNEAAVEAVTRDVDEDFLVAALLTDAIDRILQFGGGGIAVLVVCEVVAKYILRGHRILQVVLHRVRAVLERIEVVAGLDDQIGRLGAVLEVLARSRLVRLLACRVGESSTRGGRAMNTEVAHHRASCRRSGPGLRFLGREERRARSSLGGHVNRRVRLHAFRQAGRP